MAHILIPFALLSTTHILGEEDKIIIKKLLAEKKLPWQLLKRLEAIRLLSKGLSQTLVAKQLCVRREIIYLYNKTYLQGGLDALLRMDKPGKETKLTEEMLHTLENHLASEKKQNRRPSNKQLADWLYTKYHLTISPNWLSTRLTMRKHALKSEPWK